MANATIYFDNNATTPMANVVKTEQIKWMDFCANPSSSNKNGKLVADQIDQVRSKINKFNSLQSKYRILFTSGATESNCFILRSVVDSFYARITALKTKTTIKPHIITTAIEHHSILECLETLSDKIETTLIKPNHCGEITAQQIADSIKSNTILISVMYANNEIGTIMDIKSIGEVAHKNKIPFHTDATQIYGKTRINIPACNVDALTMSWHKLYGPRGLGMLIIADTFIKGYKLQAQITGTQQYSLRGGTENFPAIIAASSAIDYTFNKRDKKNEKLLKLKTAFLNYIKKTYDVIDIRDVKNVEPDKKDKPKIILIGSGCTILPNTILLSIIKNNFCNIKFKKKLEENGIIISIGSACNTKNPKASHVLYAINAPKVVMRGVIRISFGDYNTITEVKKFSTIFSTLLDVF
jgi:cysteine desulfurase